MHYIVFSLCHAGGIFKMLRPLQGLFVLVDSSTVCKTVSAIVFYNNTCSRWDFMIGCVGLELLKLEFPIIVNTL